MTGNIIARRYAKALFALGRKKGDAELAAYGKDLDALTEVLETAPVLLKVFANPIVGAEEKKSALMAVVDKLSVSPMVRNFLGLLAEKERLSYLPEIAAYFKTLLDASLGVVRGKLTTAVALAGPRQDELKTKLETQTGKKLELTFGVDSSILGGVVLKVGDKVLDASIRAQLEILKDQIKRGD